MEASIRQGPRAAPLRVAVIGMGRAGLKHALVYSRLPYVELVAVCDLNRKTADGWAQRLAVEGYTDPDRLLDRDDIDAVSIVIPDHMHLAPLTKAVAMKKHILIEKPITSTIEDALRARELLTGYDRVFGVAHLLRFDARFAAAKRAIADGELGEILGMSFRRNSAVTGGRHYGRFADVHVHVMVHDIDLAQWYTGSRATSVYARSRSLTLRDIGAQDIVFATVEYENGVLAGFEACWTLPRTIPFELHDTAEIIGTEGVVYIDSCAHGVSIIGERRVSSPDSRHWPEIGAGVGGAVQQEILEFVRCIIDGRPFPIGVEESLASIRVSDAITRSLRTRKEVGVAW